MRENNEISRKIWYYDVIWIISTHPRSPASMFLVQGTKNERVESVILDTWENNVNYVSGDKLMFVPLRMNEILTWCRNRPFTECN